MTVAQNHIIERLPSRERKNLLAVCEPVQLLHSEVLCEADTPAQHVYFPTDGFISLVTRVDAHPGLEMAMVGREGMIGVHLALGVANSPLRVLVQGSGASWRIGAAAFSAVLEKCPTLLRELHRYVYVLMAQNVTSAGCLRFHLIGPRLARWLLMSEDRAHADNFHVTQEFLAYMMGVRRVGVTVAASELQRRGLITYRRGAMSVLDREGLENAACSCYAADQTVYGKYLG